MLQPLDESAKDIAFAQGVLEGWVKDQPPQVQDYMKTVVNGVDYWRQKYYAIAEDYEKLNTNYTNLTITYGQALQQMQFLKDQNTELLIDQQKEFHTSHADRVEPNRELVRSRTLSD